MERCRKKLELEAKHATAEIFGRKSWSADFGVAGRATEEVRVEGASDGKGRKRKIAGIFNFLETGRWREAVQIMVDEHRDAQIDNRRDL